MLIDTLFGILNLVFSVIGTLLTPIINLIPDLPLDEILGMITGLINQAAPFIAFLMGPTAIGFVILKLTLEVLIVQYQRLWLVLHRIPFVRDFLG